MTMTPKQALKASLVSIVTDESVTDIEKGQLVDETIAQYAEHVVKLQGEQDRQAGEARRLAKVERRARMEELAKQHEVEKATMVEPQTREEIYAAIQKGGAALRRPGQSQDQAAAAYMRTPEGDALLRKTRDAPDNPVRKSYHAEDVVAQAETTGNPVFDEHIWPRVKALQETHGLSIEDATKLWEETDVQAPLLKSASGFAPRQTGGRTAFAINDPRAALAQLEALKAEIRVAHPWMTAEQLDREAESRRRALDLANAGNRARSSRGSELPPAWGSGSSPGRV
jgi:hypothetical protein